jgi:hypothetical protein
MGCCSRVVQRKKKKIFEIEKNFVCSEMSVFEDEGVKGVTKALEDAGLGAYAEVFEENEVRVIDRRARQYSTNICRVSKHFN